METNKINSRTVVFECLALGMLAGGITALALMQAVFGIIAAAAALGFAIVTIIYIKRHPAAPLTDEEKADPDFMKKYSYAKSSLMTVRIILYVLTAAFGVMLTALIFGHYMIILFAAPFLITSVTMLLVNRVMFTKVDVTQPPKENNDGKKDTDNGKDAE